MHRRFHKRRWTLTCFLAAMVILPTAAVLQKDNDAQNKSAAHAYAEKEGAAQSVSWNVVSDGYGWEEETAPVAAEISAELPEQKASADAGETLSAASTAPSSGVMLPRSRAPIVSAMLVPSAPDPHRAVSYLVSHCK